MNLDYFGSANRSLHKHCTKQVFICCHDHWLSKVRYHFVKKILSWIFHSTTQMYFMQKRVHYKRGFDRCTVWQSLTGPCLTLCASFLCFHPPSQAGSREHILQDQLWTGIKIAKIQMIPNLSNTITQTHAHILNTLL